MIRKTTSNNINDDEYDMNGCIQPTESKYLFSTPKIYFAYITQFFLQFPAKHTRLARYSNLFQSV